jgi:hypothetical protein
MSGALRGRDMSNCLQAHAWFPHPSDSFAFLRLVDCCLFIGICHMSMHEPVEHLVPCRGGGLPKWNKPPKDHPVRLYSEAFGR